MRVRCPACAAPYFLPAVPPPDGPRCPNCDAPAPAPGHPARRERPRPEEGGRSRVVGVVGALHWLVAAGGLCFVTGMSAVIGRVGADPVSAASVALALGWAGVWAAVGTGILRRWQAAWSLSVSLLCVAILLTLFGSGRNLCATGLSVGLYAGMLCVMLARYEEFRRPVSEEISAVGVDNISPDGNHMTKFCLFSVPAPPYRGASRVTVGFFFGLAPPAHEFTPARSKNAPGRERDARDPVR